MSSSAIRIKASGATIWSAIRTLDLSFISPNIQSVLQSGDAPAAASAAAAAPAAAGGPESAVTATKDRKEIDRLNTLKSYATEWVKPGSVRSIALVDGVDSNAVHASVGAANPKLPLFFPQTVTLTAVSDKDRSVEFELTSPTTLQLDAKAKAALAASGFPAADAATSVLVPTKHRVSVHGSDAKEDSAAAAAPEAAAGVGVEVKWESTFADGALADGASKAYAAAYQTFVLEALRDAVTGAYPHTPRRTVFDDYHGTVVADPYRWLEDPDSEETKAWVDAQNAVTEGVLASCSTRDKITNRLLEMYQFERYSRPAKAGPYYYYFKNDGLQNQSVLWQTKALEDAGRVFLDPHTIDAEGTAALGSYGHSKHGRYFAYGVCRNGSDWNTIFIRDTDTMADFKEDLHWVRFSSISWTHEDKPGQDASAAGFFYSRYPAPKSLIGEDVGKRGTETDSAGNQALYYHKLGTDQKEDKLVFSFPENPSWMISGAMTDCGKYLTVSISDSCDPVNRFFLAPLPQGYDGSQQLDFFKLVDNFDALYDYVTNQGSLFYFRTNLNAPRNRVVTIDVAKGFGSLAELIPEPENSNVLSSVGAYAGRLVAVYNIDVCDYLKVFSYQGVQDTTRTFNLPPFSSIGTSGDVDESEFFIQCTSMLHPGISFVYDFATGKETVFKESKPKGFVPSDFTVSQVFVTSKDGTKIPMFITHRSSTKLDGSNPAYLYGYGGFNITLGPSFSVNRWMFMQHFNGVVAVANLRGGGEYGETWHKAGSLREKQNVFDDFQAAAKFLIDSKYSTAQKIAIHGGSNGGLLVAACANQAPALFGAAVAAVGVLDMLRFHRFTIGYAWCSDYGNAETSPEDFRYLHKYSPLHNVGAVYPAMMLTTADHDDRVVPLHSLKYISQVQRVVGTSAAQVPSSRPVVIRVETKAGHGAGKPLKKQMAEHADVFGFFAKHTGAIWTD